MTHIPDDPFIKFVIRLAFYLTIGLGVVTFCTPAPAAPIKGLKEAIVLDLGNQNVAICMPIGAYNPATGLPLWCIFSTVPALDSKSKKCIGTESEEGRAQDLTCDVQGS